jgi:hypothetical protein
MLYGVKLNGDWYATGFESEDAAWLFVAEQGIDLVGRVTVEAYEPE